MFEYISGKDNPKIKTTAKLIASSKYRRETGLFVLEGMRLCCDAAQNGIVLKMLFITGDAVEHYSDEVAFLADNAEKSYIVDNNVFAKISDTVSPQGIIAVCARPDIDGTTEGISSNGRYIACENVSDPANLGTISRTAEALGADGMILIGSCCDPFGGKAQRAAMGSLLRLPLYRFDSITDAGEKLHERSVKLFAAVVDTDATPITDIHFSDGSAVVIGNEGNGLTDDAKRICDQRITIPIKGRAESFNAAAAASILLWELLKVGE